MIISKTPFRVSLFGGSTDYESFYSKHGSLIIGFCMNQYCYITLRKTPTIFPYHTRISYSKIEEVKNNTDIYHNGVRGVLDFLNIGYGLEINHLCDIPSQTGIGSSSSFVVGLLNAISSLEDKIISKKELADYAIYIERKLLKEVGGIQDQIWAAYGGFNSIRINTNGSFEVLPLQIKEKFLDQLFARSILIYTGSSRNSFEIAKSHDNISNIENKLKIKKLAEEALPIIEKGYIGSLGELLDESWKEKQKISPIISNSNISEMYDFLKKQGMIGGKLLGAGGSGFIYCIMDNEQNKKDIIEKYPQLSININISPEGSHII